MEYRNWVWVNSAKTRANPERPFVNSDRPCYPQVFRAWDSINILRRMPPSFRCSVDFVARAVELRYIEDRARVHRSNRFENA